MGSLNVDLLPREWRPLSLSGLKTTPIPAAPLMEHLGENRNKLFLKPPNTLVEDYCIPPTLPCVRKTAGQLFSAQFHLPTTDGTQIVGRNHQEKAGVSRASAGFGRSTLIFRVMTSIKHTWGSSQTLAHLLSSEQTIHAWCEFPPTEAQSVIGSGSLPLRGRGSNILFSVQLYLGDSYSPSITAAGACRPDMSGTSQTASFSLRVSSEGQRNNRGLSTFRLRSVLCYFHSS